MAIGYCKLTVVSARDGGSAVGAAAYQVRGRARDGRTGQIYDFTRKREAGDLVSSGVLLPDGASEEYRDWRYLANAMQEAEARSTRRNEAQFALNLVVALPKELSHAENEELFRAFLEEMWVRHGIPVAWAVHAPHEGRGEYGDLHPGSDNPHGHAVIATRRLEGDRFASKKARDLGPVFRRGQVSEAERWNERWRDFQNRWFEERGIAVTVDAEAIIPGVHLGKARFAGSEKARENELRWRTAEEVARDIPSVIEELTRKRSTFTRGDVSRLLGRHGIEREERADLIDRVISHPETIELFDERGEETGRYTSRAVRREETEIAARIGAWLEERVPGPRAGTVERVGVALSLSGEQADGLRYAAAGGRVSFIVGNPGTGKSYLARAIRVAYEQSGYEVVGLAPTNRVARALADKEGFAKAHTLHSAQWRLAKGRDTWSNRTVLVIDEAAMIDTPMLVWLTRAIDETGARVVFLGDPKQLQAVERAGMAARIVEQIDRAVGTVELREVRRQADGWSRRASEDMARGEWELAITEYARRGSVTFASDYDAARETVVREWVRDLAGDPDPARRFVYCQTNEDVEYINLRLRQIRSERGEIGRGRMFETVRGRIEVSAGDRVQTYANRKKDGILNGLVGTVEEAGARRVVVALDNGRRVEWDPVEFPDWGLAYASTVYRVQGSTIPYGYYLHGGALADAATSFVAMTRHVERLRVVASAEETPDVETLVGQMRRMRDNSASLDYLTEEDLRERGIAVRRDELEPEIETVITWADRDEVVTETEFVPLSPKERVLEWLHERAVGETWLHAEVEYVMNELVAAYGDEKLRRDTEGYSALEMIHSVAERDLYVRHRIAGLRSDELRAELTYPLREQLAKRISEHLEATRRDGGRYGDGTAILAYGEAVDRCIRVKPEFHWIEQMYTEPAEVVLAAVREIDSRVEQACENVRREVSREQLMVGVEGYLGQLAEHRAAITGSADGVRRMVGKYLVQRADEDLIEALGCAAPREIIEAVTGRDPEIADMAARCGLRFDPLSIELERVAGLLRSHVARWNDDERIEQMIESGNPGKAPDREAIRLELMRECVADFEKATEEVEQVRERMGFAANWRTPSKELERAAQHREAVRRWGKELLDRTGTAGASIERDYHEQVRQWRTAKLFVDVTTALTQTGADRRPAVEMAIQSLWAARWIFEAGAIEKAAQAQGVIAAPSTGRISQRKAEKTNEPTRSNDKGMDFGM